MPEDSGSTHATEDEYDWDEYEENAEQIRPTLGFVYETREVVNALQAALNFGHFPKLLAIFQGFGARLAQLGSFDVFGI